MAWPEAINCVVSFCLLVSFVSFSPSNTHLEKIVISNTFKQDLIFNGSAVVPGASPSHPPPRPLLVVDVVVYSSSSSAHPRQGGRGGKDLREGKGVQEGRENGNERQREGI